MPSTAKELQHAIDILTVVGNMDTVVSILEEAKKGVFLKVLKNNEPDGNTVRRMVWLNWHMDTYNQGLRVAIQEHKRQFPKHDANL